MSNSPTIEDRISDHYSTLSASLQKAADYVAGNPIDVATRSLRSASKAAGVSPATFSRLARVLGFDDYEALREAGRAEVGRKIVPFSERAQTLRQRNGRAGELLQQQTSACLLNIRYLEQSIETAQLEVAVEALHAAEQVLLVGAMGSAGLIDHFGYQAQWFKTGWNSVGRHGASVAAALAPMGKGDAVFALVKAPYAAQTIGALRAARAKGVTTLAITDSPMSPALSYSDHRFVVATESGNFFSSYCAALVLMETIIAMLLTRAGSEADNRIRDTETQIERLGETWPRP